MYTSQRNTARTGQEMSVSATAGLLVVLSRPSITDSVCGLPHFSFEDIRTELIIDICHACLCFLSVYPL